MATAPNNIRPLPPTTSGPTGPAARMAAENRRYAILAQLGVALFIGWVLANALALTWRGLEIPQLKPFGLADADILAFIITGAAFIYTMRHARAQEFADEVMVELRKVTWPSWKETRQATIVCIIVVAIIAGILGGFDLIWAKLIKAILTI